MMQSSFFDAVNRDRVYNSADWSRYFSLFIGNGVFAAPDTAMQVRAVGGMDVAVSTGSCWIDGRTGTVTEEETVTIDIGDSANGRYDAVVARLDFNKRDIHIDVIKGTAAAEPVRPAPVRTIMVHDLVLAYIHIAAGVTELRDADIEDKRADENLCGFVKGLVDQIETGELFKQYDDEWDLLRAGIGQDEEKIIAAWEKLNSTKSVSGVKPVDGDIPLDTDNVLSGAKYPKYTVQWGEVASKNSSGTVNFETAFKSAPVVIAVARSTTTSTSGSGYYCKVFPSASGFFWSMYSNNEGIYWIAFGDAVPEGEKEV